MYVRYGTITHDDGKVLLTNFTTERVLSQRGLPERTRKTATIRGYVTGDTQSSLKTKIALVEAGYGINGQDFGLYHDDGIVSAHYMPSSTSITGVRVVGGVRWEVDNPAAEYATQRTFSVTLTADYIASDSDQLLFWYETLSIVGNGGPRNVVVETITGTPIQQTVNRRTSVRAVQSGRAIGLASYPTFPVPLWPQYFLSDQGQTTEESPRRDGTNFVEFPISWSYQFHSPVPLFGNPNAR